MPTVRYIPIRRDEIERVELLAVALFKMDAEHHGWLTCPSAWRDEYRRKAAKSISEACDFWAMELHE